MRMRGRSAYRSLTLRAGHIEHHHCQGLVSRIRESMGAPRHVTDHVAGPDLERLAVEYHPASTGDDDVNLLVIFVCMHADGAARRNLSEVDESERAATRFVYHARGSNATGSGMGHDVGERRAYEAKVLVTHPACPARGQ